MGISDIIAGFIQQELEEAGGALELQRSDLAQRFNCVPSQINYVMSTRFSPEHGYIVESRRGGGGYIRITRVQVDRQTLLMHVINSVGDTLDYASARAITQNLVDSEAVSRELGQALLAKYMGKTALVAETGAGQHGVATAVAAARLGMSCTIYMGAEDVERQAPNVMRMRLLGATVHPVESGSRTLKDAINEALRAWIVSQQTTHYCFGTAAGPHPFPTLVRMFQQVIGQEVREQMLARAQRLPDAVGANAIGLFHPFLEDERVRIIGVEAAGTGEPGCFNSAPLNLGSPGVLHGNRTMLLQNSDGQIEPSHSVSAGLDYPGVGPEHAFLHKTGRVRYVMVRDARALAAFEKLCHAEGILPALESSHALAWVLDHPEEFEPGSKVVVNLSGRGDKDLAIVRKALNLPESGDIC